MLVCHLRNRLFVPTLLPLLCGFAIAFSSTLCAQNPGVQQPIANGQAGSEPISMQLPDGFPLTPEMDEYVGQLLNYWQQRSDTVKAFKCDFTRYDYDTSLVNYRDESNRPAAAMVASGEIRYAATDRAMFETLRAWKFKSPPEKPGEQADYEELEGNSLMGKTIHERWMCDGKAIYDFDFEGKQLLEIAIPPQLQGNVVDSPLPFLFGANKQDILNRYWVRYVPKYRTDANGQEQLIQDEYWLEAFPKKINDSRMYSKLEIILDRSTCMPKAIHMYEPNYNPEKGNLASRYFAFQNHEINGALTQLQDKLNLFVKPRTPIGWRRVTQEMGQSDRSAELNSAQGAARK